jgi:hypothetical protein
MRTLLFFSSYAPLFVILGCRFWASSSFDENRWALWLLFGIPILALLSLIGAFFWWVRTSSPVTARVTAIQRKDSEVMAYVVTYLLPFVAIDFDKPGKQIATDGATFLALVAMLALVYVNSNLIHINPTLNVFGYHVYEVETEGGGKHTLICKRPRLLAGTQLSVVAVGDDIFMEKR